MRRTLSRLGISLWKNTLTVRFIVNLQQMFKKGMIIFMRLTEYRNLPTNEHDKEIWTDESYIHHHLTINYSGPSVSDFVERKHKGRRLVMKAAGSLP